MRAIVAQRHPKTIRSRVHGANSAHPYQPSTQRHPRGGDGPVAGRDLPRERPQARCGHEHGVSGLGACTMCASTVLLHAYGQSIQLPASSSWHQRCVAKPRTDAGSNSVIPANKRSWTRRPAAARGLTTPPPRQPTTPDIPWRRSFASSPITTMTSCEANFGTHCILRDSHGCSRIRLAC